MKEKIKVFVKDNYKFILLIVGLIVFFNLKLPYYVMAGGGSINITDRVVMDGYNTSSGSINMLYVSEYDLTPSLYLISKIKSWDIHKNNDRQVSNESRSEIAKRDKIMRDNSLDVATLVAYREAGYDIKVKNRHNIVIATTLDNNLKVGDEVISIDNIECNDINEMKKIITNHNVGDEIKFSIIRDGKNVKVNSKVLEEDGTKIIGVVFITSYEYEKKPDITIKFRNSESGSSGGLMLTLTIYNALTEEDIIKGRDISGTGTINEDGTVGEIDGVKYKIMGAEKDKMDIVFVPSGNYEEAVSTKNKYKYDLDIVKVDTFMDVINYLKNN